MKRAEIIDLLEQRSKELGIPGHLRGIKKVPSKTEMDVVVGVDRKTVSLRSGATRVEVDEELRRLESWWVNRQQQVDLEEAIADAPLQAAE